MKPRFTIKEAVAQVLAAPAKRIIDVGCGDGAIVRYLAQLGAEVIGVEVSESQLQRALAKAGDGETYKVASAERLPCPDAWADAILFLNSFHHVPRELMAPALLEAMRVLAPDGRLIVIEPLAEGAYFEAMRPLEDETEVRAAAYAVLKAPPPELASDGELFYESVVRLRDADHFLTAITSVDPVRRERLPPVEGELRRRYEALVQHDADGAHFVAPMRRNVFRKTA